MSWLPDADPRCDSSKGKTAPVETVITPNLRDLEGFSVRRVLPAPERRAVGPFVFFDHMGPTEFAAGQGLAVRPHPHIGLSTLTYLYQGHIVHRDSLGFKQLIRPGEINWMTAGRGIVHSERSPEDELARVSELMGLQVWVALPRESEEIAPAFTHYSVSSQPEVEASGVNIRVVAGEAFGLRARLKTLTPLFFVDIRLQPGATTGLEVEYTERAVYIVRGSAEVDGQVFTEGQMAVLRPECKISLTSAGGAWLVAVGGEPLDGPRHMWWNFVASDREAIERAKTNWQQGKFGHVPGDSEAIPLPD